MKKLAHTMLRPTDKSRWAYAASKMVDEFLGLAYFQQYGLPVVPFRLFNTVGPRQAGHYGMVVPRLMRQALRDEPITVYGDGWQSRCFCGVSGVARALAGLIVHSQTPGILFNIGNTEEVSISALAKRIKRPANSQSPIRMIPYSEACPSGFEDMQRRIPDTWRIRACWAGGPPSHWMIS